MLKWQFIEVPMYFYWYPIAYHTTLNCNWGSPGWLNNPHFVTVWFQTSWWDGGYKKSILSLAREELSVAKGEMSITILKCKRSDSLTDVLTTSRMFLIDHYDCKWINFPSGCFYIIKPLVACMWSKHYQSVNLIEYLHTWTCYSCNG